MAFCVFLLGGVIAAGKLAERSVCGGDDSTDVKKGPSPFDNLQQLNYLVTVYSFSKKVPSVANSLY